MYETMKKMLKVVLILLVIAVAVYIAASTYFNKKHDEQMRPALEQNVADAFSEVEAITSYTVLGKELTKIQVGTDAWNDATEDQRQVFVRDAQKAVTIAAMDAGYDMDLYSGLYVYDSAGNKIAEADSSGRITIY